MTDLSACISMCRLTLFLTNFFVLFFCFAMVSLPLQWRMCLLLGICMSSDLDVLQATNSKPGQKFQKTCRISLVLSKGIA